MQKLHTSIIINAPKEKVWDVLLGDDTFRQWTSAFAKGSHFKGSWEKGSKIYFLAPDENGVNGGMVSQIAENKPNEYLSIEHLGVVQDGVEDTSSETAKKWGGGATENYTLKQTEDGNTELLVDMDIDENEKEMFDRMWPEALQKLKELAES